MGPPCTRNNNNDLLLFREKILYGVRVYQFEEIYDVNMYVIGVRGKNKMIIFYYNNEI